MDVRSTTGVHGDGSMMGGGEQSEGDDLEEISDLRAQALINDIERRVSAERTRLFVTRWLSLPLMVLALVAMVVGLIQDYGTRGSLIGGVVAAAGAVGALVSWGRRQEDDIADLEDERESLLQNHPVLRQRERGRISTGGMGPSAGGA